MEFHTHPQFWTLQEDLRGLPLDATDAEAMDQNPELADILRYLFVEHPGTAPEGYALVEADRWESANEGAELGRRSMAWTASWVRVVAFACLGTVCAAGIMAVPRWSWAEAAVQKRVPSMRPGLLGRVGTYVGLFAVLCGLLAGLDHPFFARTFVD